MKQTRRNLVAALTLAAACSGWTGLAMAQPASKEPLKFGLAMPLTGSQALFGADQAKAEQWAVQDINAKGGVDGHPLEARKSVVSGKSVAARVDSGGRRLIKQKQ